MKQLCKSTTLVVPKHVLTKSKELLYIIKFQVRPNKSCLLSPEQAVIILSIFDHNFAISLTVPLIMESLSTWKNVFFLPKIRDV